jgi:hypothetical protein
MFQKEYSTGNPSPVVIDTMERGYLAAGSSNSLTAGGLDGLVMKLTLAGNLEWGKNYGGSQDDRFYSMQRLHNGNYILAGVTRSFVNFPSDSSNMYVVEIDTSGTVIHSRSIGTSHADTAYAVKETLDHGFILAGTLDSAGHRYACLIKTDSLLSIQWSRIYANNTYDLNTARAVVQTSDGGFGLTGYSASSSAPLSNNMFLVKTDSSGNPTPAKHYFFTDSVLYSKPGSLRL